MRLCGIRTNDGNLFKEKVASERILQRSDGIHQLIKTHHISQIVQTLEYTIIDARNILAEINTGVAVDIRNKRIDQGTILEELVGLEVCICKIRDAVRGIFTDEKGVPSYPVLRYPNGSCYSFEIAFQVFDQIAHDMATLEIPRTFVFF